MRLAVHCAKIDAGKELRDNAAALAQYAKQRPDTELDSWMSEIKLRAAQRIGQLSRELERRSRTRARTWRSHGWKFKEQPYSSEG
jgi:hypothetical protein